MAAPREHINKSAVSRAGAQAHRRRPPASRSQELFSDRPAAGIKQNSSSRLRVLQFQKTDGRKFFLAWIGDLDGDEIVPSSGALECLFEILIQEVADQENNRPPMQDAVEVIKSRPQARSCSLGLKIQNIANQAKDVPAAFPRRHETLDFIRKLHQANAVI